LSDQLSEPDLAAFLRPYFWGSSQGFNKTVLPAALKAHSDEQWRAYIKSIIREENTPSCHAEMFRRFIESLGIDVGERPMAAERFVADMTRGYSAGLGYALGYALGVETEADFQIAVVHAAFSRRYPEITRDDEYFLVHMSEHGEEAHAAATCECIEALVARDAIEPGEITRGFHAAIVDTRNFVCGIHAELSAQAA
jgi:pyrroloquinoline quinone (PQQ) biosynthesis protein C